MSYNLYYECYDSIHNTLDIGDRRGMTDYIDFLTQDEVKKNVMKGIDCYSRKFITIKIGGYDLDTGNFFRTGEVFFQRYTGEPDIMGANFDGMFIWTVGGTTPVQYELIHDLLNGKSNMDYWENHFARIIQRNWIICRYNPRYAICKKILNEQYNEYISSFY
jgi:hypothetical protein